MKMPVTLFGAGGFVGAAIMRGLAGGDIFEWTGLTSRDANLADRAQVASLAKEVQPASAWVMAAARSPDWHGTPLEGMRENLAMATNLVELMAVSPPRYVVYLSSIDVYGRTDLALPLNESTAIRPGSYYAVSKYASERMLALACAKAAIPLTILRLPGVYGPGDTHWGPVHSFLHAAIRHEPITVHGDGEQRRDLVFVRDIPRVLEALCRAPIPGTFNLVTGRSASLNAMLRAIAALTGEALDITYKRDTAQIDLVFEPSALARALPGWALTEFEDGLRETYHIMKRDEGTP